MYVLFIKTTKDDVKTEIYVYKDGIYIPQGKCEVKEFLRNLLGQYYSIFIFNLVMAKLEVDTYVDSDTFFNTTYKDLVAVKNGILNVRTRELESFTPMKIFLHKKNMKYVLGQDCPKNKEAFKKSHPDPNDWLLHCEINGAGLDSEQVSKLKKAIIKVGPGNSSKSTDLEITKIAHGPEECTSIPLSAMKEEGNFAISELFGKTFNIVGDLSNQDLKETGIFKSSVGRDLLIGNRKFLKPIYFVNKALMIFACNDLPMVYAIEDKPFWERWVFQVYKVRFVSKEEYDNTKDKTNLEVEDKNIIEKLTTEEELSGLLNEFLDGLDRLRKNKRFTTSLSSEEVKQTWIRKSNSFMAFCLDNVKEDSEGSITKKDLRFMYTKYCKKHKLIPKSDIVIKNTLQNEYGVIESRTELDYFWVGITIKNEDVRVARDFEPLGEVQTSPIGPKMGGNPNRNEEIDWEYLKEESK